MGKSSRRERHARRHQTRYESRGGVSKIWGLMRVGIVAILQESNTFIHQRTTLAHFKESLLVKGEAMREMLASSHHEVGGFFQGLASAAIEAVPIFAARALPFG